MKKRLKYLFSMQFALLLLIILAIACSVGSFVTQGQTMQWYAQQYSEQMAGAIMLLGLDDVFHCWWFIVLTLVLCGNLLGCNVLRFPSLMKKMKQGFKPEKVVGLLNKKEPVAVVHDADGLIKKLGFHTVILPEVCQASLEKENNQGIRLVFVKDIREAISCIAG